MSSDTAVYAVVDKSKKKKHTHPDLETADKSHASDVSSPVRKVTARDMSTKPASEKKKDIASEYSVITMDNMHYTTKEDEQVQETLQGNSDTNKTAERGPEIKKAAMNNTFACIFISIAALATLTLVCIVVLSVEILKLKNQRAAQANMSIEQQYRLTDPAVENYTMLSTSIEIAHIQLLVQNFTEREQHLSEELALVKNILLNELRLSCMALPYSSPSGYYWVRASNGSAVRVYCDMTRSCGDITGGWMRVDMTNSSHQCPSGLTLRTESVSNIRACVTASTAGCVSITIDIPYSYSRVCGRVIAYQVGATNAFHHPGSASDTIDNIL